MSIEKFADKREWAAMETSSADSKRLSSKEKRALKKRQAEESRWKAYEAATKARASVPLRALDEAATKARASFEREREGLARGLSDALSRLRSERGTAYR